MCRGGGIFLSVSHRKDVWWPLKTLTEADPVQVSPGKQGWAGHSVSITVNGVPQYHSTIIPQYHSTLVPGVTSVLLLEFTRLHCTTARKINFKIVYYSKYPPDIKLGSPVETVFYFPVLLRRNIPKCLTAFIVFFQRKIEMNDSKFLFWLKSRGVSWKTGGSSLFNYLRLESS